MSTDSPPHLAELDLKLDIKCRYRPIRKWQNTKTILVVGEGSTSLLQVTLLEALFQDELFLPGIDQSKLKSSSCKSFFCMNLRSIELGEYYPHPPKNPNKPCPNNRMVCKAIVHLTAGLDLTITSVYVFESSLSPASPRRQNLFFHLACCAWTWYISTWLSPSILSTALFHFLHPLLLRESPPFQSHKHPKRFTFAFVNVHIFNPCSFPITQTLFHSDVLTGPISSFQKGRLLCPLCIRKG